ncbi:hypothetical protein D3879_20290 [Pseudomonas cavernicola]|uniref:DUF2306 domain-containing protein n=1 Tax=Pseudomonas cavernicola TaxID=2320866 RepID=A0A418XCX4_9PSED|nr:hypothetical protein [Pseudomonas cavernicola]RJG10356.1 hypothetical protein D3879_20290 [Pseudomonas cavernicola]
MNLFYQCLLILHILAGSCGLLVFWLPVAYRKGGLDHKRYGRVFARAMYAVGGSGLAMACLLLLDPQGFGLADQAIAPEQLAQRLLDVRLRGYFLGLLAVLLIAYVRHGVLVLSAREDRASLRVPLHVALNALVMLMSLIAAFLGYRFQHLLLMIFSAVGFLSCLGNLRYSFKATISRMEWLVEHLRNLIATGIAAHTAFLVFGVSGLLSDLVPTSLYFLPWIVPTLIGTPAIVMLSYHYRRKFEPRSTGKIVEAKGL